MEEMKKIGVILSGVLVVVVMVWMLTLGSKSQNTPSPLTQQISPQPDKPAAPAPEAREPESPPDPDARQSDNAPSPGDTISWRTSTEMQPYPPTPSISGKIPFSDNPNTIFVNAARQILPAVVSIRSSRRFRHPAIDFFPHFFPPKKDGEKEDEGEKDDEIIQPGSGSGIIISDDGYIMTNYHVVEESERLQITLYDKREFDAELIGGDPTTDVALLKVKAQALPVALMGNSDSVQIGEWVMAVGNPLNFTSTVTAGIISALGRNINIIDPKYRYRIEHFIQTDAVINPGNSGGALVNLKGEVIGLNTAIATRNGYYQGYGFAIPVNLARKVVTDLLKFGRVRRAILGVVIEPVTDNVARAVGLARPGGALIQGVTPGSPAGEVGMRQGDVVLKVEGEEVVSVNDLQTKIARHYPGETVRVTIWRERRALDVAVTLAEAPEDEEPAAQKNGAVKEKFENLGIGVRELTGEEKERLSLENGLLVEKVAPGSPAESAGVFSQSIILSINNKPLAGIAEFEQVIRQAKPGQYLRFKLKDSRLPGEDDSRVVFVEVPKGR
ncbi:MAG: Do family serine endopeptidase [Calditrichaceae bacterium]|nr:Do family serine endopeptidase [Calditrichia bacterium]NUQ40980.1 Do family serine endopeptidase [Calditrichaceae bacterium]